MATLGEKKTITWRIAAKDLSESTNTTGAVASFIAAAKIYVKGNAKTHFAKLVSGPIGDISLFLSVVDIAFSRLASETGHKGIEIKVPMVYSSWSKHQGGKEVTVYGWVANGIVNSSCYWY